MSEQKSSASASENVYYPSEIHRLLRIGDNLVVSGETVVVPDAVLEKETVKNDAMEFKVEVNKTAWISRIYQSNMFIYPAVFLIAFLFFYSVFNFQSLISQVSGWFAPDEDRQILGDNLTEYYAWMGGYFFSVGNKESLEPSSDVDRDGLSNMDEFVMRTNPIVIDSDSDAISDGIEVLNSSNPWGDGGMREEQTKLADSLDLIKINNRISFNVASTVSSQSNWRVLGAVTVNYDLTRPGKLSIPKLNLQAPIIWTSDPKDFGADLTRGVVHYPGTALPGQGGIMYVSGHSSDYPWKKHAYKQVFAKLNALEPGDDIFVDVYGQDGKLYNFRYQVNAENIYKPDDQAQFTDGSGAKLNLSTCWPIGTQKDRYVVTAILTSL